MITKFNINHLDNFKPNKYSSFEDGKLWLNDKKCKKFTMIDKNNTVLAIIVYKLIAKAEYAGFFLISELFKYVNFAELNNYVKHSIKRLNAKRIVTVSRDDEVIERWHLSLGMKKVEPLEVNGKQCNLWEATWA
jgi:hypothetical protein